MKVAKLAAVTLSAALFAVGCSSADETTSGAEDTAPEATASESTSAAEATDAKIVIWTDAEREEAIKAQAEAFQNDTGATVEVVQKNFEDLRNDFVQQVPTGEGPDITVGAHDWLGALVTAGVVDTVDIGGSAGDFEQVALDAFTYDGQLYGLPYSLEAVALIQNTDLVGEEAPATWDEMIQKGEESGAERPFVINTAGETGDAYTMYAFQTSFGAPVFVQDDSGSYTNEVGMGGDEGKAFANWLSEQGDAGYLSTTIDYDINNELFNSGEAAYTVAGPWVIPSLPDVNVKVNPIPSAGGETAAPFVGVQGFYLSAQSENKLVANDFLLNYLGSEEGQQALYEADPRIPALTSVAEGAADDPVLAGFLASSQTGVPMPSIPEMGAVWDFWNAAEAQIISGADPDETWDGMISNLEEALQG